MKLRLLASALFAGALAGAAPASAAVNLLTNGSFETGSNGLTGWTVSTTGSGQQGYADPVVISYNSTAAYPNGAYGEAISPDSQANNPSPDAVGNHALYFSSDVGTQSLSQTVALLAGHTYSFGFDYYLPANGYGNANNATLTAAFGNNQFASFTLGSQAATTWLLASASQTFTSGSTGNFTFNFAGNGYPAKDVAIDRVYLLDTTAVPEPSTWLMMILGFGAIGFIARKRSFAIA